jgi:hypothetical protein
MFVEIHKHVGQDSASISRAEISLLYPACGGSHVPPKYSYLFTRPQFLTWIRSLSLTCYTKLYKRYRRGHEDPEEDCAYSSALSLTSLPGRFTSKKETRYLFYRKLGGLQGQSGRVRKISQHRDSLP